MSPRILVRLISFLGALLGALCLASCNGSHTGSVSGKITYHGKPVALGSVVFVEEDTLAFAQEEIRPDGTFQLANVPFGSYKVSVHSPDPLKRPDMRRPNVKEPRDRAAPPRPGADKWFAISERYSDWRQSGLSVRVSQSHTTFNVELTD